MQHLYKLNISLKFLSFNNKKDKFFNSKYSKTGKVLRVLSH